MNSAENKEHRYLVTANDFAMFNGTVIHNVCSTYALTREFEWAGRLVLLPLLAFEEEGIGTCAHIQHLSPAFEGEEIHIKATPRPWNKGEELLVDIEAFVGTRKVATGYTGQRILPISTIQKVFEKAKNG
jgi:predicted thioesterase